MDKPEAKKKKRGSRASSVLLIAAHGVDGGVTYDVRVSLARVDGVGGACGAPSSRPCSSGLFGWCA